MLSDRKHCSKALMQVIAEKLTGGPEIADEMAVESSSKASQKQERWINVMHERQEVAGFTENQPTMESFPWTHNNSSREGISNDSHFDRLKTCKIHERAKSPQNSVKGCLRRNHTAEEDNLNRGKRLHQVTVCSLQDT